MKDYIFTFGYGTNLAGCFVRIPAESSEEARTKMFDHYGPRWAFQYDSEEQAGVQRYNLTEVPLGTKCESL